MYLTLALHLGKNFNLPLSNYKLSYQNLLVWGSAQNFAPSIFLVPLIVEKEQSYPLYCE